MMTEKLILSILEIFEYNITIFFMGPCHSSSPPPIKIIKKKFFVDLTQFLYTKVSNTTFRKVGRSLA